ncbi:MAG: RNA polymerase sigma factor region1.1 domain-containing protein, partial [Verrucomicrobiota bacterium]
MLKRKAQKTSKQASKGTARPAPERPAAKAAPIRRRFVISSNATGHAKPDAARDGKHAKTAAPLKPAAAPQTDSAAGAGSKSTIDLTETIKTLLHLAQENGYVTYDDINDILPDNLNPDDLDELYTKLRTLEVEIVDQAEVERAKPAPQEEDEDARLEILDDP